MSAAGIVLDTNVVSEPNRPRPDARVAAWYGAQTADLLYLTSITVAEIAFGIRLLDRGRRQNALDRWLSHVVLATFDRRILSFEAEDALVYGTLMARARQAGHTPATADGQIAAIAHRRGLAVATRNTGHFAGFDIELIDPWAETGRSDHRPDVRC